MPNKGKYGPNRKHCTSCIFHILHKDGDRITCRKHLRQFFRSHYCEEHIDVRSNKGKQILKHETIYNSKAI